MPLAVPRAYLHDAAHISNNAYYRGMGFLELDDPTAPSGKVGAAGRGEGEVGAVAATSPN